MIFTLHPMAPEERAIVADSWVESFKSSARARLISLGGQVGDPNKAWHPTEEYWSDQNELVDVLLDECRTLVLRDDMGLVAGFLCWEPWESEVCVHYLYTRLMYRKQGVAKRLVAELPGGGVLYTHRSRGVGRVPEGWRYSERPLRRRPREAA